MSNRLGQRRNVEKQEAVVAALWEFAANMQLRPNEGQIATIASGQPNAGTKVSVSHVGTALEKVMRAFGYAITEIQ